MKHEDLRAHMFNARAKCKLRQFVDAVSAANEENQRGE